MVERLSLHNVYQLGLEAKESSTGMTPVSRSRPSWRSMVGLDSFFFLPLRSRMQQGGATVISTKLLVFRPSESEAAEVSAAEMSNVIASNADSYEGVLALADSLMITGREDIPAIPVIAFGGRSSLRAVTEQIDALIPEVNIALEGLGLTLPSHLPEVSPLH